MQLSLPLLARRELDIARDAQSGRSAKTVVGDHTHQLRQTVIALRAGQRMSEHRSPGEATLQILDGRVLLTAGEDSWSGLSGDLIVIPAARHSLDALDDSVLLLTVVVTR